MQTYQTVKRAVSDAIQGARDAASEPAADGPTPTDGAAAVPPAPPASPRPSGTIVIQDGGGAPIEVTVDHRGIHLNQGAESTTIPVRDIVPHGLVQLSWALVALLALFTIGRPVTRAVVRWIDRRAIMDREQTALREELIGRLAQLERNLDTAAVEIERLAEVQRFTARQLAEPAAGPPSSSRGP